MLLEQAKLEDTHSSCKDELLMNSAKAQYMH